MASNCSGVLSSSRGGLAPPGRALRRADARLRDASRHMSGCGAYCIEIVDRIEIVEVVMPSCVAPAPKAATPPRRTSGQKLMLGPALPRQTRCDVTAGCQPAADTVRECNGADGGK